MNDRVFDLSIVGTVDSPAVTHFLGITSTGALRLVSADSMMVFRGVIPTDIPISIDDTTLPMGIYSLTGNPDGTFPVTSSIGAAMLLNWKAVGAVRFQILIYFWANRMFIRRRVSGGWGEWMENPTQPL